MMFGFYENVRFVWHLSQTANWENSNTSSPTIFCLSCQRLSLIHTRHRNGEWRDGGGDDISGLTPRGQAQPEKSQGTLDK